MHGLVAAATVVVLAARCGGDSSGPNTGMSRASLLAIARADAGVEPPSPTTCSFKVKDLATCLVTQSDSSHTMFAQFTFFAHSIVQRNDTTLADTSTVFVTINLTPGVYGFTLGPASLVFNLSGEPIVAVAYGPYGDPSVYTMSSRYASAVQFTQALELWRERTPDRWVVGRNSTHSGPSTVSSALESPGAYLLAAPK